MSTGNFKQEKLICMHFINKNKRGLDIGHKNGYYSKLFGDYQEMMHDKSYV